MVATHDARLRLLSCGSITLDAFHFNDYILGKSERDCAVWTNKQQKCDGRKVFAELVKIFGCFWNKEDCSDKNRPCTSLYTELNNCYKTKWTGLVMNMNCFL